MPDSIGLGAAISLPLGFLILLLDLYVAFNPALGDWGASFLVLPFAIFLALAALLVSWQHPRMAKGLAIGGVVVSLLIIFLIFFFALLISACYGIWLVMPDILNEVMDNLRWGQKEVLF